MTISKIIAALALSAFSYPMSGQTVDMVIDAGSRLASIAPTMYGIFFEDINFAADGGLYAEKVMNRSFEYPNRLAGWTISGEVVVRDDGPFDRNPHYLCLLPTNHSARHTMIENGGYFGIGVKAGEACRLTFWACEPEGGGATLKAELVDRGSSDEQQALGEATISVTGAEWKKYEVILTPRRTLSNARLRLWGDPAKTTHIDHVSLFPVDTYRGDDNGLRRDLAEALEQLHPGVLRFPGGCIVEGADLATRYQWKNTVGPVENRPLNENRWHYTFTHRYYPDYYQSGGLGFYEYFRLAEEIGAEPLPVVSVGMSCQFQNDIKDEARAHVALDDLGPYINDCIDLIDFANADASTNEWGRLRAEMGHPAPFGLKYLAIGNEQWDYPDNPAFTRRLERFVTAVRKAHPEVLLIGSTGPNSEGADFDHLQQAMTSLGVDLYDEHFYRNEAWFTDSINRHRYDSYPRAGRTPRAGRIPKVFAGEYACHGEGKKWNHYNAALLEAQFMTGFERNADVVRMTSYAPLFAHVEGWQWRPDAIWFDNLSHVKTASYYVQQMYATNRGDHVLALTLDGRPVCGDSGQQGLSATASLDDSSGDIIVKVTNISDKPQPLRFIVKGLKRQHITSFTTTTLQSSDLMTDNTLASPSKIVPRSQHHVCAGPPSLTIPEHSFVVCRLSKE